MPILSTAINAILYHATHMKLIWTFVKKLHYIVQK